MEFYISICDDKVIGIHSGSIERDLRQMMDLEYLSERAVLNQIEIKQLESRDFY